MPSEFLTALSRDVALEPAESRILDYIGVRSAEEVYALTSYFPSLAYAGLRVHHISNVMTRMMSAVSRAAARAAMSGPPSVSLGANPPPGSATTPGSTVGMPPPLPFTRPLTLASAVDLRMRSWPVRDQGHRGTCVAFGTTACVEHFQSVSGGPNPDYSEQFLYWAIKDHSRDPNKTGDGTWLQFARDSLAADGICSEGVWPYIGAAVTPVSGQTSTEPTAQARTEAALHLFTIGLYNMRPTGAATAILQGLQRGRPVAVSLPVFVDPTMAANGPNNWTTQIGWLYGRVLNPPPRSVVVGGHCVCVTGFVPDQNEPNGGHFIIRNSWGGAWGSQAPAGGTWLSPEPGYGEISATYVDSYCWELLQL